MVKTSTAPLVKRLVPSAVTLSTTLSSPGKITLCRPIPCAGKRSALTWHLVYVDARLHELDLPRTRRAALAPRLAPLTMGTAPWPSSKVFQTVSQPRAQWTIFPLVRAPSVTGSLFWNLVVPTVQTITCPLTSPLLPSLVDSMAC